MPTSPTPGGGTNPGAPSGGSVTLLGTVVATNGNQPLSGITVSIGGFAPSQTNAGGEFSLTLPPSATAYRIGLLGAGIVERQLMVSVTSGRNVSLDAIRQDGTFDLAFYRQLVRDSNESSTLQSLRRWTRNPNFLIKTVDESGAPMDELTIAAVEDVIRESTPAFSGNKLQPASIERGRDSRVGQSGWITVRWPASPMSSCGLAQIAQDGGFIDLSYRTPGCRPCPGPAIARSVIRHELGHALGFYHTDRTADLMNNRGFSSCDQPLSSRERYHAAIAYSRPVGNTDPDIDPSTAIALAPAIVRH